MGLFEEAGRRFERFKREATDAAEESAEYECAACGERLFTDADRCTECGAEEIVAIETDGDGSEDESADDEQ